MATFQDKLTRIIDGLEQNTGLINVVPGTKIHQMSQSVAYEGMLLEKQIEDYTTKNSILYATGPDLDNIGENVFGVSRLPEIKPFVTESMKCLKFYVKIGTFGDINRDGSNMPNDIMIPEGTLVRGDINGIIYSFRVNKDYTLPMSASELYISADMIQGRFESIPSNVLTKHNFTEYTQSRSNLLLVTNPTVIGTGRSEETDNNYRFRISKALRAFPRTTYYGIYDAAISVAGVSNITIEPSSSGGGTFTVYVQGVTPITGDEVVANVEEAISEFVPPWVSYKVVKYFPIGLEIGITATVSEESTGIASAIQNAIADLINNYYGSTFQIDLISRAANTAHAKVYDVTLDYVNLYVGDTNRIVTPVDLTATRPEVFISNIEKLVVEPIANAINVTIMV